MRCITKSTMKTISRIVLLGILVLSLFGCSKKNPSTDSGAKIPVSTGSSAEPRYGGQLQIPMPLHVATFDPLKVQYRSLMDVLSLVYEPFVALDATRKPTTSIAESWTYNATTNVWRFFIRKGVKWHGGDSDLTAADVEYTMNRILLEDTVYSAQLKSAMTTFTVIDPYCIEIAPVNKGQYLLYALNFPVVKKDSVFVSATGGTNLPVGTGPFKAVRFSPGAEQDTLELGQHDTWWKKKPYISKIVCRGTMDDLDTLGKFSAGKIDVAPLSYKTLSWTLQFGANNSYDYLTTNYEYIVPNYNNTILAQKEVRQAIALSIDTRDIITKVYANHAVSSDIPIMPDSWLHMSDILNYDYDPNAGRSILTSNGWSDSDHDGIMDKDINGVRKSLNFQLLCDTNDNDHSRQMAANMIKADLLKVGINVDLVCLSHDEYIARINSGQFDAALMGYKFDNSPDLSKFLSSPGIQANHALMDSVTIDTLMNELKDINTDDDYLKKSNAFQTAVLNELPFIGLYYRTDSLMCRLNVYVEAGFSENVPYQTIDKWYLK